MANYCSVTTKYKPQKIGKTTPDNAKETSSHKKKLLKNIYSVSGNRTTRLTVLDKYVVSM